MKGVTIAYYLLHSMEGDSKNWKKFAIREKQQAQNFLKAASDAGIRRIIYLGGLVNENTDLSIHMKSRKDVGQILASGNIPVTELRASVIVGAEGGSYAMLRYLVERLRVMICPKWVKSQTQPIAVDNVIDYLAGVMTKPETTGKVFEIGGPEKMTYEDLMQIEALKPYRVDSIIIGRALYENTFPCQKLWCWHYKEQLNLNQYSSARLTDEC